MYPHPHTKVKILAGIQMFSKWSCQLWSFHWSSSLSLIQGHSSCPHNNTHECAHTYIHNGFISSSNIFQERKKNIGVHSPFDWFQVKSGSCLTLATFVLQFKWLNVAQQQLKISPSFDLWMFPVFLPARSGYMTQFWPIRYNANLLGTSQDYVPFMVKKQKLIGTSHCPVLHSFTFIFEVM